MNDPMITLIVAASQNDVIGKDNDLPWHLPRDLRYFKSVTSGCPIIMGRKTYESIGKALPNRLNIVISRNRDYRLDDAQVVNSLDAAIAFAKANADRAGEIHIIGGATIFASALEQGLVDKLYLNRVLADFDGDTFLPAIPWADWELESSEHQPADEKNPYPMDFNIYLKHSTN